MPFMSSPGAGQGPPCELVHRAVPELVLQCGGCRAVLSDYYEYVGNLTIGDTQFLATRAVSSVAVDKVAQQQKLPPRLGHPAQSCTFYTASCASCGACVGRLYTACPDSLAPLRNAFALDAAKCESYALGSCGIRVASGAAGSAPAAPEAQQPGGASLAARLEALEVEMLKLQGMVLLQNSQLSRLPGYQIQGNEAGLPLG